MTLKGKPWSKFKNNDSKSKTTDKDTFTCKRCGEKYKPRQCPAYEKICAKCKRKNHYARMCLSKKKSVHTVQEDMDDSEDLSDTFFIKMMSNDEHNCTQSMKFEKKQSRL